MCLCDDFATTKLATLTPVTCPDVDELLRFPLYHTLVHLSPSTIVFSHRTAPFLTLELRGASSPKKLVYTYTCWPTFNKLRVHNTVLIPSGTIAQQTHQFVVFFFFFFFMKKCSFRSTVSCFFSTICWNADRAIFSVQWRKISFHFIIIID